jgi:hypothetical protein
LIVIYEIERQLSQNKRGDIVGYLTEYECQTALTEEQEVLLGSIVQYPVDMLTDGSQYDSIKWYGFEKDVKEFSKHYPDQLFEWHGKGEEQGDVWRAYVKNGKYFYQKAKLLFVNFHENLLK